jgi:general L-amino acid transport system substrate-binding protein
MARWMVPVLLLLMLSSSGEARPRLEAVRRRGFLTCGVFPYVAGFAQIDRNGHYAGLDVDICRALSAAIFGTPDKVQYIEVPSLAMFLQSDDIDVMSRRLTWELGREAPLGLLFGPVIFYDGQGFLVAKKLQVTTPRQLSGVPLCVAKATFFESNLSSYFRAKHLTLQKVPLESSDNFEEIADALATGRCGAYTADVSELGAIRSKISRAADFEILDQQISKEPLAQLVRQDDIQFFDILRWTVFALVAAEELGITSKNIDEMRTRDDVAVRLFLGIIPGNGTALGLSESWASNIIRGVGNYGEMFERNVGRDSSIKLDRGLNRLWTSGGLMYAPPVR